MGDDAGQSTSDKKLYRFGVMAVFRGYATLNQIQQAIAEQVMENVNGKSHRPLGTILREKGWMTEEQEKSILKDMLGEKD